MLLDGGVNAGVPLCGECDDLAAIDGAVAAETCELVDI
jgi:hypothetical protein